MAKKGADKESAKRKASSKRESISTRWRTEPTSCRGPIDESGNGPARRAAGRSNVPARWGPRVVVSEGRKPKIAILNGLPDTMDLLDLVFRMPGLRPWRSWPATFAWDSWIFPRSPARTE